MKSVEEVMYTVRPEGKRGTVILKRHYEVIRSFILDAVASNEELTLTNLLEKARLELHDAIDSDVAWYVLQVKLDLEAHRLIELVPATYQKRLFFIQLTPRGIKQIKSEKRMKLAS
jgi:hypothetical protein